MRDTCDEIQIKQYKKLRTLLIPLFIDSHDRYYLNVLWMTTLFYRLYIDHERYSVAYLKNVSIFHETLFIRNTRSKWDDDITW